MSNHDRGSIVARKIRTAGGSVHVADQPGDEPALVAIRAWTAALVGALDAQDDRVAGGQLGTAHPSVTLIFGALDRYLNPDLAAHLAGLFQKAELHAVDGASHWPQWDQPEVVSRLIP
jgi:pimeloyl-ACP methyl ester carboxylesterase